MDFFQRLGNFFTGKGWINDDEKRRKEQQPQPVQQQPVQQSTVQQPAWIRQNAQTPTISQPSTPKVNLNPLQQANQATQQLNLNSQNNQLKPQVTANDAPKVLTPQGQQDWANQQNKQIQAHNMAVQPPKPQPAQQPVQQPQQVQPKPVLQQKPQPQLASPSVSSSQNLLTRSGIEPNPTYLAIKRANEEVNQYKADQARRQDALDETMRARGIGEPEIAKSRQTRIQMENEAREAAYEAQKARNIASVANIATAPGRATASFVKGVVGGAGRSIGDTGDKLALAISDAMYGITGDERYNRGRQRILEQGKQRNEQYDKQFGVFNKNDADVDIAYELGEGGQRLAQDMGTAVVTGGTVPVARAFAENAADFVTDANAHGKNTRDVLPAAYANATAQSAIEKIGLDKVLTPGGKTAAVRMLKGALAEGGEEAAQQLVGNAFAKHTYDPNRKYSEGVVKSALMGVALGGPAGAGNFGGVRQTSVQPSVDTSTQVAQNQQVQSQQSSNAQPAENTSLRQAAEVSAVNTQTNQAHPIQQVNVNQTVETTMPNASPALKQAVSQNISDIQRGDTSAIATRQQTAGKLENYLVEQATQSVQNMVAADVRYKLDDQPSIDHTAEIQAYNDHLGRLRQQESNLLAQGLSENSAPVINNRKAQAEAIYARNHVGEMSDDGVRYKLSPAQEEFFKDSKIRDENGNLKTVYHGTKSDFDEFSRRKIGSATDPGLYGTGFYFSDHEGTSRNYGDRVIKAHLNIKNPLNLGDFNSKESLAEHLRISPDILSDSGGFIHPTTSHTSSFSSALRYAGYDGVIIPHTTKGARGNEIVALDPEQIKYIDNLNPTDSPDMRYRIDTEAQKTSDTKQDLINRSREVMGDSAVLFADLGTFNGRDIDGFYRDVEGVVYIAEGKPSLNTLNHELVHRVMASVDDRARNNAIDYIVKTNGAENLVTEYQRKGYDIKLDEQGVKVAAEEKLADDFMEYAKARAKGTDIDILGKRLHIPGEIVAYFERIWQSVRSFAGKADLAKQLYAQMETGKFRGIAPQTRGGVEGSLAYKIDPESAKDAIARFNSVKNGWRRKTIMSRITPELAQMYSEATGFRVSSNAKLVLTDNAVRHMKNSGHLDGKGHYGIEDTNPITDADIADIPLVFAEPDNIKVKGQKGYRGEKIELSKQLDNMHILAVELEQKPNGDFYIVSYYNKSRSPRQAQASGSQGLDADFSEVPTSSRPKRPGEANKDSLANLTQNVNTDPRYRLNQPQNQSLQEIINNIQDNPKPRMTKELRQAIDEEIYNYYPELFVSEAADLQSTNGDWNIPRLHVDDLRHYLGELANDIPSRYKRRDGKRDIDTVAQEMGYDDIDSFIDEIHRVLEARRNVRASKQRLAELRRDPDIIADAQQALAAKNSSNSQPISQKNNIQLTANEQASDSMLRRQSAQSQQSPDEQLKEIVQNQPLEQQGFKNIPLEDNHLLTKGNLYEQTKPGIRDDWTRPFQDGDYEYRLHTKRSRDGKKRFNSFERRYIGDNGEPGDWMPTSRAAYIWKSQTKSIDKINRNEAIQKALEAARQDGEVQEFMAYKNPGRDGGVMVMPLTGEHSIDGGFVRNPKTGEIEGNYIQVTPFGVVHQTNGKFDVVEADRLTNALGKSKGSVFDNFNRLIEKNINDEEGQKALKDLYYQKTEAYAKYADTLNSLFAKHNAVADLLDKSRGKFTSSKRFWEDVGRYTEGIFPTSGPNETMNEAFARKYGTQAAERVKTYDAFMRENYDAMIKNLNAIRRMYGKEEIPYLENYMPHIQKRSGLLGRAADRLLSAVPTGIRGDIEGQSRGEIPASIAGLSADFKPGHKFNPNEKHRHGGMMDYEKDPRKAFEHYADLMLYNTHMEPVIARGRQIESSMRATDMAKKSGTFIDPDSNLAQGDTVSNKATIAVQDFVNEIAGKSSSLDRPFIDRANKHIQFIQRLESVNGANKILGNLSSTLAQTLNLPETVRDNGVINTGHAFLTAFDKTTKQAMRKSPFLRERYTDTDGKFTRSGYQKVTDKISVVSGMNLVEKKFIQLNWAANYYRFQKQGLTGYQLIKAADQATERAVGGRGIGAMPQAYKSTLGKMFLQFTYETNESWKNNISHVKKIGSDIKQLQFKDAGSGAVRAAEAFAVAYGMNMLMKQVTGDEPLANMVDAVKDVLSNDADDDGEDDKLGQKIARIGSEASKMNPVASAAFNLVPKSEREKIFGKSSDLGRFDGATGVAQTAANALGAGFYAAQGDSENAQKNLQGLIPAGGQLKKTMGGAKVLQEGGDVYIDKNGKERTNFEVDSGNAWNQAKALLFGKNAVRPDEKSAVASSSNGDASRTVRDFERGLKKGTYKVQDDLVVNKKGDVQRSYYKALAESQGESDEAYSNWMKAYNIDDASTLKKEFNSSNDILNKLENGEKKANKAKSAVDILMGKHKDLPDWVKERYYKESGYSKDQIEYGAMTTHKEVSLMDNYWRQKAQESSHEELMQALTNGRRKSITGQMFAKNGVINKLRAEGYITKWEARALNAAQFDVDGNRITKEMSGGGNGRSGFGRSRGSRTSSTSPLISAAVKNINSLTSATPKANQTSVKGININQIGQNLINRSATQRQVNATLKQWNSTSKKNPKIHIKKARA
jgi:putative mediator of RNA polymerase II transcription subunit 12